MSRSRRRAATLSLAAVASFTLSTLPAYAGPEQEATPRTPPTSAPPIGAGTERTITLITGDVVHLATLAGGRQSATVQPHPDSTMPGRYTFWQEGNDLHVVPAEALPYLSNGQLGEKLFNVSALVREGYDDASSASLPLLLSGAPSRPGLMSTASAPAVPTAATDVTMLESIGTLAVEQPRSDARRFWESVDDDTPNDGQTRLAAGVDQISLDARVHVSLAENIAATGAPQAWDLGYDGDGVRVAVLDTGYDATHPDLAGRVVAAKNFSDATTGVRDIDGHGTHVAALVAGSGAASDGEYRGVAPGVDLLVGKVLNDSGSAPLSWVVDGMEWAVAQDADIVNMSLGTGPTGGQGRLTQAVESLSASSDTLFVVAAGNAGLPGTIGSPAEADAALTVGSINDQEELSWFSSRGPRAHDGAVKPDLVAPGEGIVSSRAENSVMAGNALLLGPDYAAVSGTSQATPHVTGAAAILAQAHPDWDGERIKNALVNSARHLDGMTPYQQGTGMVDIPAALDQRVRGTAAVAMGQFPLDEREPAESTIEYRNDTDQPVTLDLTLDVRGDGAPPGHDPTLTVSPERLTVPAGGTATATLRLDPADMPGGDYRGYLTARGDDVELRTTVGFTLEAPTYDVTLQLVGPDGEPAAGMVHLWNMDTGAAFPRFTAGERTVTVPAGRYSFMALLDNIRPPGLEYAPIFVGKPDVTVDGDMTVRFESEGAREITIDTPRPTSAEHLLMAWHQKVGNRSTFAGSSYADIIDTAYAVPMDVDTGEFEFLHKWDLQVPTVTAEVRSRGERLTLDPYRAWRGPDTPFVELDGRYELVDAGDGAPEEFAAVDTRGKIALVRRTGFSLDVLAQAEAAAADGATAMFVYNSEPSEWRTSVWGAPVPTFTISQQEGQDLLQMLDRGRRHRVRMDLTSIQQAPYVYDLIFPEDGGVPEDLSYDVSHRELARIDARYKAHTPEASALEVQQAFRPYSPFSVNHVRGIVPPLDRTNYISTGGDTVWVHKTTHDSWTWLGVRYGLPQQYEPGERRTETYFDAITRPAVPEGTGLEDQGLPVARFHDAIRANIPAFVDPDIDRYGGGVGRAELQLRANGELVGSFPNVSGQFTVPPERTEYELSLTTSRDRPWWTTSTDTSTTWTFESETSEGDREVLPLLQVEYGVATDMRNTVSSWWPQIVRFDVGHQPGYEGDRDRGDRWHHRDRYGLKAWVSYDDGANWRRVPAFGFNGGRFMALVPPAWGVDEGFASLRVEAWDSDGNRIEQEITRAYRVTSPWHH